MADDPLVLLTGYNGKWWVRISRISMVDADTTDPRYIDELKGWINGVDYWPESGRPRPPEVREVRVDGRRLWVIDNEDNRKALGLVAPGKV